MDTDKLFKENPNLDQVYKTSDDTLFFTQNSAQNHAQTLKNKTVEKITKPIHVSEEKSEKTKIEETTQVEVSEEKSVETKVEETTQVAINPIKSPKK